MRTIKGSFLLLAIFTFITSCKKDKDVISEPPAPVTTSLKDSALHYTRDIYLWYNQIPSSFNAQSYNNLNGLMTAVRQYSSELGFATAVDRWSFAIDKTEWDNLSSGISGDFGVDVFFRGENDLRVKAVEPDSPAGRLGIKRGWRITRINGSTNISTTNIDYIVNALFKSGSANVTFLKPDGTEANLSLSAASYQSRPVLFDSIYTTASGKAGYIVFHSFLGDTTEIYNAFQRVFNGFAAAGVKDVVVDLRYNGGGYVSVQEKLANYLIPAAYNGNIMMKQQFNDKYARYNETTTFQKQGALNAERLFFIVSKSTASASELLINNLKPYMNLSLVGPSKTYGKPVGYFPISVGNSYIFPVSFRTTNKAGEGSYFEGMAVNKIVADGLDKDWGDVGESALASILGYLNGGTFRAQQEGGTELREQPAVRGSNEKLDLPHFRGTVDTRQLK